MYILYYTEVNLICIIILLLFKMQLKKNYKNLSAENKVFDSLVFAAILTCIADMFSGLAHGQTFPGARVLLEVSNLLYFEFMAITSFIWMMYVYTKYETKRMTKRTSFYWAVPLIIFTIVVITNPFTGFIFTIDADNLYSRAAGVALHWLVAGFYLLVPTVKLISMITHEPNRQRKKELAPVVHFIIPPAITAVIQMLYYGVSLTQVGITISIVAIALAEQDSQIFSDALTGLNNRRAFYRYIDSKTAQGKKADLTIIVVDIDDFKLVNDRFGHIAGDLALKNVSNTLKKVLGASDKRIFLSRYGGDEFLVASTECTAEEIALLVSQIHEEMDLINIGGETPCSLKLSIGFASGTISSDEDVRELFVDADLKMYENK